MLKNWLSLLTPSLLRFLIGNMNLNPKELKSLKKDELVKLVLNLRDHTSSPQAHKPSFTDSTDCPNRNSVSVCHSASPDASLKAPETKSSELRSIIFEAVHDIKVELRLEYINLLKEMKNEFQRELAALRDELNEYKKKNDCALREVESEFFA